MTPLLLLSLSLSAPLPKDAVQNDPNKLEGVWRLTARETRGQPVAISATLAETYTLVISKGEYAFRYHAGTIALDSVKKTFDMKVTDGRYKNGISLGRFERSGNTLKMAMRSIPYPGLTDRPADLTTGPSTVHYLYTFERDPAFTTEKTSERLKEARAKVAASRPFPAPPIAPPLPAAPAPQPGQAK
jgi:hypothetical protein